MSRKLKEYCTSNSSYFDSNGVAYLSSLYCQDKKQKPLKTVTVTALLLFKLGINDGLTLNVNLHTMYVQVHMKTFSGLHQQKRAYQCIAHFCDMLN